MLMPRLLLLLPNFRKANVLKLALRFPKTAGQDAGASLQGATTLVLLRPPFLPKGVSKNRHVTVFDRHRI